MLVRSVKMRSLTARAQHHPHTMGRQDNAEFRAFRENFVRASALYPRVAALSPVLGASQLCVQLCAKVFRCIPILSRGRTGPAKMQRSTEWSVAYLPMRA